MAEDFNQEVNLTREYTRGIEHDVDKTEGDQVAEGVFGFVLTQSLRKKYSAKEEEDALPPRDLALFERTCIRARSSSSS